MVNHGGVPNLIVKDPLAFSHQGSFHNKGNRIALERQCTAWSESMYVHFGGHTLFGPFII